MEPSRWELYEIIHYDPKTGIFRNKKHRASNARAGQVTGCTKKDGYHYITIKDVHYMAHRIAWIYRTGEDITGYVIDHRNEIKNDNRWLNLRKATVSQNGMNVTNAREGNISGLKGVSLDKYGKWRSRITVERKEILLGYFDCKEEAKRVYDEAAKIYHGEFAK